VEQKVRFESPRLETRFEITDETLRIYFPDGRPFESGVDINARAEAQRLRADKLALKLRELGIDPDAL
jgi:hypothetical protein